MTFSSEGSSRQEVWMDKKRRKSASWNVLATAIFAAFRTIGRRPFRFRNLSVVSADIIALIYPEESAPNDHFIVVRPGQLRFHHTDEKCAITENDFPLSLTSLSPINQFCSILNLDKSFFSVKIWSPFFLTENRMNILITEYSNLHRFL